jgi:CheY-like chemotaxis protein
MGGIEAYEHIKKFAGKEVPVIFMTGYCLETGKKPESIKRIPTNITNALVIQKPYKVSEIGDKISKVLNLFEVERELK